MVQNWPWSIISDNLSPKSIICRGISKKFRARNCLFLHEFEPKESRRATKVNWICIYIFCLFWAYIITNLRVNKSSSTGEITFGRFYKLFEI